MCRGDRKKDKTEKTKQERERRERGEKRERRKAKREKEKSEKRKRETNLVGLYISEIKESTEYIIVAKERQRGKVHCRP